MPSNNRNKKQTNQDKTKPYRVPRKAQANLKRKSSASNRNNRKNGTNRDNSATKKVKTVSVKTKGKNETDRKNKTSKHPKLVMALKVFVVIFLLLCVIVAGVVTAMFFGVFGDDFEISKEELVIGAANSVVLDKDGNEIANLSKDEKRKIVSLDEMADYLPKAYVAIEDKRFYEHDGVDWKRTAGAIANTVFKGGSAYGGSTITQQLVKNITGDKEASGIAGIMRKVKEWSKAYQVERMISKNQILELYLNILFVGGGNIHGVELGSQYYFNKSAKDLDLAECAFLAGINNSPNEYNPYDTSKDQEKVKNLIKKRTLTVLSEMKDQGYITNEDEYNAAVAKVETGLTFTKGNVNTTSNYSYHTDATIKQIVEQVMEEKNVSREFAEKYVYSSGLTIYSTEDPTIQARVEEEFNKSKYIVVGADKNKDGSLKNDHTQAGMAIIDYKTGNVVAVGGSLGEKYASGWNRATQMVKQTGSSIKPIADVAPGLQEKVITAATIYDDVKTDFGNYAPKDDGNHWRYLINVREFIKTSQNVPAVKIMRELTPGKSIDYLRKMGITTLYKNGEDPNKNDEVLSLAIGGVSDGVSPLQMAAAYGTIANDGVYITPTFYTKVVDSNGNIVLTPKQEKTRVISEQNAYITRSITEEPLKSGGTATYCAISGMEVCAKTGTTDNSYDRWLCGMTPYYSAAVWYGYDVNEEVRKNVDGRNPAGQIWSAVMKDIHKNLPNAQFNKPSGIQEAKVCSITGCLATSSCTKTYTEIFTEDNMPEKCEGHGTQRICTDSNKVANEYCPQDKVKTISYGGTIPKETLGLWKPVGAATSTSREKVTGTCTIHTKPVEKPKENNTTNTAGNTTTGGNATNNNTTGGNTNTGKNETGKNTAGGTTGGNTTGNTATGGETNNTNKKP